MRLSFKHLERGDTLTEVMFATAVAALVIVLATAAMNRSFAQTQMSVETTFVRQSMDEQAEILRFARDQYKEDPSGAKGKIWRQVLANTKSNASTFGTCFNTTPPQAINLPSKGFYLNATDLNNVVFEDGSTFQRPDTFAETGKGIWIEAVQGPTNKGVAYVDFHIRACWEPPYSGPETTLGTIVRLYYEVN